MIKLQNPPPLSAVSVYAGVTVGAKANIVLEDDELKTLVGKKVGTYGRHWVYGDRVNDKKTGWCGFQEANIVVVYGTEADQHLTFVGRSGLNKCIEFLAQFDR